MSRLQTSDLWRMAESFSLQLRRAQALGIGGRQRLGQREAGSDFEGYQPYRAGDDIRHVDWSVYGRSQRLFVRRFRDDRSGVLAILLDASGSMGLGAPTKWAFARAIGTVVALAALRELHHVSLGVINGDGVQCLPNVHGLESGARMVDFLSNISPRGETDLDAAVRTLLGKTRGADVLIVSDFLDPMGGHAGLTSAAEHAGHVHLARLTTPAEFVLPNTGALLSDPESQMTPVRTVDETLKSTFMMRLTQHRQQLDEAVAKTGASLTDASADGALVGALESIFDALSAGHRPSG